jgi:DNA-binding CsgD family transcriptional regulator
VRAGLLSTAAVLDLQITAVHLLRMSHHATLAVATRAVELAESLRLPVLAGAGLVFVATAQGHMGRVEQMQATLDEAESRLERDVDKLAAARFARGTPALVAHDPPARRATLHDGMTVLRRNPSASPSPGRGLHALLETVLGDGATEREELRRSGATVQACNRGALAYADAVAAARVGRDPAVHLAEAERVMRPLEWRRHHMRLLVAPSALGDGWGSPAPWLREATAHFRLVGDDALARACRDRLRAAGAPVPRRGRGDSAVPSHLRALAVTSREVDVLALVGDGLSNADIAERLVLSPRTVETHVSSLLSKTGAAGRSELRRWLPPGPAVPMDG